MQVLTNVFAALTTSVAGVVTPLVAQAATHDVAPWVSAGGATAAVGGLVYIAKKLAAGELVAVPVAKLLEQSRADHDKLGALTAECLRREDLLHRMLLAQGTGPMNLDDVHREVERQRRNRE